MRRYLSFIGPLTLALAGFGCNSKPQAQPAPVASVSASVSARLPPPKRHNWPLPSGPMLAVLAGQGVGPIRIGATTATIERLMEAPCDVKTAEICRYVARGVEFNLENGVTKTIYVQRAGRPTKDAAGNEAEFGFFRGAIPPDLRLGMVPSAIEEHLGKATRVEKSGETGTVNKAETHYYPGLNVEYDRIENGNLVMSGLFIYKDESAAPSASAAPHAKAAASSAAKPKPH